MTGERRSALHTIDVTGLQAIGESQGLVSCKSDLIPIVLSNLSFRHTTSSAYVLKDVNLSFPQGCMVAVTGPHQAGKATFVELLANILAPTSGNIFVPGHLRVLHVSREPMFLRASILHNLALGLPRHDTIDIPRVNSILLSLGLDDIVDVIARELHVKDHNAHMIDGKVDAKSFMSDEVLMREATMDCWEQTLTRSHKMKLHLARALIANPEVMILERTMQGFNEEVANDVLDMLQKHVEERGLALPHEGRASRRPRSVFFTTDSTAQAMKADTILQLNPVKKAVVATTPEEFANYLKETGQHSLFLHASAGASPRSVESPQSVGSPALHNASQVQTRDGRS
jgi:ABC-type transport system involved in cytochrome bd biosynthesis fused ATPase/permease subunit